MPSLRPQAALLAVALSACTGDIRTGTGAPPVVVSDEPVAPIVVAPSAPVVRALSASEYRNTVRDLLGLSVSATLTQADWTAGFDNGSGIHVDDNLLSALVDEGEALAAEYVASRARSD